MSASACRRAISGAGFQLKRRTDRDLFGEPTVLIIHYQDRNTRLADKKVIGAEFVYPAHVSLHGKDCEQVECEDEGRDWSVDDMLLKSVRDLISDLHRHDAQLLLTEGFESAKYGLTAWDPLADEEEQDKEDDQDHHELEDEEAKEIPDEYGNIVRKMGPRRSMEWGDMDSSTIPAGVATPCKQETEDNERYD